LDKKTLILIFLAIAGLGIIAYLIYTKRINIPVPKAIEEKPSGESGATGAGGGGSAGQKLTLEQQAQLLSQVRAKNIEDEKIHVISVAEDYLTSGAYDPQYIQDLLNTYNQHADAIGYPKLSWQDVIDIAKANIEKGTSIADLNLKTWKGEKPVTSAEEARQILSQSATQQLKWQPVQNNVPTKATGFESSIYKATNFNDPAIMKAVAEGKSVEVFGVIYTPQEIRALKGIAQLVGQGNVQTGAIATQARTPIPESAVEKKLTEEEKREEERYGKSGEGSQLIKMT
jgi:hypothetical protein